jgi:selenide,water dikinase
VLRQLPKPTDPNLIIGIETADDAGVYKLNDTLALIQTVDFFPPVVDDPYTFGQIAAANSLSDVYAMGGKPLTAMNIVGFPMGCLDGTVLQAILQGGYDKVAEAGAVIAGGHTVEDQEPKYGLSVTGIVHPGKVWANAGARPGDRLVLTKALGTGILATAAKAEMFLDGLEAAIASMKTLNKTAAEVLADFTVHACTDITGFGLLGHLSEMSSASGVTIRVDSDTLPLLPHAAAAAAMGMIPGGAYTNREYLKKITFTAQVPENIRDICYDPQTSGGLLVSIPAVEAAEAVRALRAAGVACAAVIGEVLQIGEGEVDVC